MPVRDIPLYGIFIGARSRCRLKTHAQYHNYGGRGIEFRFSSLDEFIYVVGDRPSLKHSLDRIDNNGHYEKGNLRWATMREQNLNKRGTQRLTYKNETLTRVEWSARLGLKDPRVLTTRIKAKWCETCTFTLPLHQSCRHRVSGTKYDPKPKQKRPTAIYNVLTNGEEGKDERR